ncbi:MAG: hypothetical protein LBS01_10650, partial [Prevotellaceae bacterium]|nr:hypothetical protein [Prevotellaceae bacterium]
MLKIYRKIIGLHRAKHSSPPQNHRKGAPADAPNAPAAKSGKHRSLPLLAAIFFLLFFAGVSNAFANNGHGIWLGTNAYGYDPERGYYVTFDVLYYNNDGYDEGIQWATFLWPNAAGSFINV